MSFRSSRLSVSYPSTSTSPLSSFPNQKTCDKWLSSWQLPSHSPLISSVQSDLSVKTHITMILILNSNQINNFLFCLKRTWFRIWKPPDICSLHYHILLSFLTRPKENLFLCLKIVSVKRKRTTHFCVSLLSLNISYNCLS